MSKQLIFSYYTCWFTSTIKSKTHSKVIVIDKPSKLNLRTDARASMALESPKKKSHDLIKTTEVRNTVML